MRNIQVYYINIPWQQEAEGLLEEAKEGHVDPELGRQLEDVEVDWDTGGKKILDYVRNTQVHYINIP